MRSLRSTIALYSVLLFSFLVFNARLLQNKIVLDRCQQALGQALGKVIPTRRYASAVHAVGHCLSVCLSVRHKSVFY